MNFWELAVVGVIYIKVAAKYYLIQKDPGMALSFFAYALANVGFIWSTMK